MDGDEQSLEALFGPTQAGDLYRQKYAQKNDQKNNIIKKLRTENRRLKAEIKRLEDQEQLWRLSV